MASNTRQDLGKAFELIKREQLAEAIQILKPITEAQPDNVDAWWLLANASEEPRDARRALVQVLKINPSYPKARDLLDRLNEMFPPRDDELMMMMDIDDDEPPLPMGNAETFAGALDEDLDGFEFADDAGSGDEIDDLFAKSSGATGDDDFGLPEDVDPFANLLEEDRPKKSSGGGRSILRLLLLIILLVVLALVAFVFLLGGDDEEPTTADNNTSASFTEVAGNAVNAENAAMLEDVRSSALTDVQIGTGQVDVQTFYVQVDEGYALVARVCGQPDPSLPHIALDGMRAMALRVGTTPAIQSDLTMVGVSVEDCAGGGDVLYRALSPLTAAVALSNNPNDTTALTTFKSTWVVSN